MLTASIIIAAIASIGGGATMLSGAGSDRLERAAGSTLALFGCAIMAAGFLVTFTNGGF